MKDITDPFVATTAQLEHLQREIAKRDVTIAKLRDRAQKTLNEVTAERDRMRPVFELARRWCNRPESVLREGAEVLRNDADLWIELRKRVARAAEHRPDPDALKCCPRFTWGDGTHDLTCKEDPGFYGRAAARLQREVSRMRPVYEAAKAWRPHFTPCEPGCRCEDCKLANAIDAALAEKEQG